MSSNISYNRISFRLFQHSLGTVGFILNVCYIGYAIISTKFRMAEIPEFYGQDDYTETAKSFLHLCTFKTLIFKIYYRLGVCVVGSPFKKIIRILYFYNIFNVKIYEFSNIQ